MSGVQHQNDGSQHSRAKRQRPYQPAMPRRALPSPNAGQDAHLEPQARLFASILLQRGLEQFIHELIWLVIVHV
jgi:hypothetical protein